MKTAFMLFLSKPYNPPPNSPFLSAIDTAARRNVVGEQLFAHVATKTGVFKMYKLCNKARKFPGCPLGDVCWTSEDKVGNSSTGIDD